jgi:phytoene dehydrogenase-like protein
MSLSPPWDPARAPKGKRAVTISTHTQLHPWWDLNQNDPEAYIAWKNRYTERLLALAEQVLPNFSSSAKLVLPGTPVTFERFTRRAWGWVGGFPQTSLFHSWGPNIAPGMWMVGDSVFPGQSVPAVMLSGLRIARMVEAKAAQETKPKGKLISYRHGEVV